MKNLQITQIGELPNERELSKDVEAGNIPIKYCYPGKGGDAWDKLRKEDKKRYSLGEREYKTLLQSLRGIYLSEPTNIIHIGPGNGVEIPLLSKALDLQMHRYVGVDISQRMLENTIRYQKDFFKSMKNPCFILADVEYRGTARSVNNFAKETWHPKSLFVVAGQGVLCSNQSFLEYLKDALDEDDLVLITLEGDYTSKRSEIISTYDLSYVEQLLSIGLERAGIINGKFLPASFNEASHCVEKHFESTHKDKIKCLSSYKPSSDRQFESVLTGAGLQPFWIQYFPEPHSYATLCGRVNHV